MPAMSSKQRQVLDIIATDRTFERSDHRGREVWLGKCLHCNTHLAVALDGTPISRATIEHILPRTAGGTDQIENLALACASCNASKGIRIDHLPPTDPRFQEVVEKLRAKRRKRWRDPGVAE